MSKNKILVCGVKKEEPVAFLLKTLSELKAEFVFVDQEDMPDTKLLWQFRGGEFQGHIENDGEKIPLETISSIYHRFMPVYSMPKCKKDSSLIPQINEALSSFHRLFDVFNVPVVNNPRAMMSNNSKPFQAQITRDAGFDIPETLISNDPLKVKAFLERKGKLVYKSCSSVRSIVKTITKKDFKQLYRVITLPTQFQEFIDGEHVRVHVIDNRAMAIKIDSDAIDYRYASEENERNFSTYILSDVIYDQCILLSKMMGLIFSGIDLIISSRGVYCLEVNPSPAFSFYEKHSEQPLSKMLVEYLISAKSK